MAKSTKKKPAAKSAAKPAPDAAKGAGTVTSVFDPGKTKPTDAGRTSATKGGKGSSGSKGR